MEDPVVVEQLPRDGLWRLSEIDRSEDVCLHYRQEGTDLIAEVVVDPVPDFFPEGPHHSITSLVEEWQPYVDAGGALLGASMGGRLVGIAMLGAEVEEGWPQLALLFVNRADRGRGVATALLDAVRELATAQGAQGIYVSAVPSDSAVGFYLDCGFRPTQPDPVAYEREPEDVHMRLDLA